MNTTFELLQSLTLALEPGKGRSHSITMSDDGQNLVLSLSANGAFYKFNVVHSDFEKDAEELADEVLELFRQAVREQSTKPVG